MDNSIAIKAARESCEYEFYLTEKARDMSRLRVSLPREKRFSYARHEKSRLFERENDNVTSDKSPLWPQSTYEDRLNGGKKSSNACGLPGGAAGDCSR